MELSNLDESPKKALRKKQRNESKDIEPTKLEKVVETMMNVDLTSLLDFWDEFLSEVEDTDEVHENHELLEKLTQFQYHAELKKTSKLVQSYKFDNPMVSLDVHDQGPDSFTCWAYSAATMTGNSCRVMIKDLKDKNLISEYKYNECMKEIKHNKFHTDTRNSIMMILMPKQLHADNQTQSAFLRAAVSRLANPTLIDREGIFYLDKVASLVKYRLGLKDFPVHATYKIYYNNSHPEYKTGLMPLIDKEVSKKFCPVAAVDVSTIPDGPSKQGTFAMVLDEIKDDKFIFKNTYVKNKRVTIPVEEGPLEFYYLHMELNQDGLDQLHQPKSSDSKSNFCNFFCKMCG